jgi:hypothetical protein
MLNAFADAAQSVVPVVRKRRVRGEREGVAVAERSSGGRESVFVRNWVELSRRSSRGLRTCLEVRRDLRKLLHVGLLVVGDGAGLELRLVEVRGSMEALELHLKMQLSSFLGS